jgi:diguanylate cyclase (GGDEF)-like protein
VRRPPSGQIAVQTVIQLPGHSDWFMPVVLAAPQGAESLSTTFALVPANRMVAGTNSLRLLPDSYVVFVAADGERLLSYSRDRNSLSVNGSPLSTSRLELMNAAGHGTYEMASAVDGRPLLFSYVRSSVLPMYVMVHVPMSGLYGKWAEESAGPVLVLLIGTLGIVGFARRLRNSLKRQQEAAEREQYRADHDSLTGLPNRDEFVRRIDERIEAAQDEPFTVVVLDISKFKDINDTLGHSAGDEVLTEIGRRLAVMLDAEEGFAARMSGDEFAILASGPCGPSELAALHRRLHRCLGRTIVHSGVELELAARMGAAVYPEDARSRIELMRCADIAMNAAKSDVDPIRRYREAMDNFTPQMLALKAEFAKALREERLSLVYQPKVRLSDGALIGAEALTRWRDPVKGWISPAQFIPLAENSEFIHPFTRFVLKTALQQVARWRAAGHEVPVSVNVSVNNLLDPAFTYHVETMLRDLAVPARLLELEVTESALMRHLETILRRLRTLRDLGVKLSIDDFGSGYASLSYLKRLPVHTLKIDQSFVAHLVTDAADQRIVRSSVQLAHGFDMTVVAEGVESAEAAALLAQYGCDAAQGFHFARPLPAAQLEADWLRRTETA